MTTHTGRVFLNSCLKVPIDPCNNCPAPIYNRPKIYLGRSTITPTTTATKLGTNLTSTNATEIESESLWNYTGIRSLVKLYDSIPDYCDMNHLPEEEFYSTLDTLRSTCRELGTKAPVFCSLEKGKRDNSCHSSYETTEKTLHIKKKKSSSAKIKQKKSSSRREKENKPHLECSIEQPCSLVSSKRDVLKHIRQKSFKEEFEDEIKDFQRKLKEFEEEFKRPHSTATLPRSRTTEEPVMKTSTTQTPIQKDMKSVPTKASHQPDVKKFFKKSFSFNDLHNINITPEQAKELSFRHTHIEKLSKAEMLAFKDPTKFSNYFKKKVSSSDVSKDLPKIKVDSPSSSTTTNTKSGSASLSRLRSERRKLKQSLNCREDFEPAFTLTNVSESHENNIKLRSPSPVHPVARPNLAATLRAEVSKKKVKELQSNCTYHDTTPQTDWEVRKTPAWKSLTLLETHKQILALRLATRKTEQEVQKREYDLNMELMRQRVKSAPLLLEGVTHWGPHVGKLTHTCGKEGLNHFCETTRRKTHKRSSRRNTITATSSECGGTARTTTCDMHEKYCTLRKVYGKNATPRGCNGQRRTKALRRGGKETREVKTILHKESPVNENDSGDELCSVDRAYL